VQSSLADFIFLNKLSGSRKNKVILVFDGYPPSGEKMPEGEGLLCLFSRMIEADELIKKLVEESGQPANIVVVSDDKAVRSAARLLRAKVSAVEEFICGGRGAKIKSSSSYDEDDRISYSKMQKINEEFKKRWLE
jgi:hypothetical protein